MANPVVLDDEDTFSFTPNQSGKYLIELTGTMTDASVTYQQFGIDLASALTAVGRTSIDGIVAGEPIEMVVANLDEDFAVDLEAHFHYMGIAD